MLAHLEKFILSLQVARLSTLTPSGAPHTIPICFALFDNDTIYTPIDTKPKKDITKPLKRIENIANNDEVVVLFDRYSEDWGELAYVMAKGKAKLVSDEQENLQAMRLLENRYIQYRDQNYLPRGAKIIGIRVYDYTSWGNL
ncbi:MAG: TIGR03668 family PPOX class F420-dependent oxidoreductase [SAR202 cluster bacterium]|jgi:PPOX class probable F420-dependent enzyme|nr:TIGR03668 family PPOX class F420-dependent oxidoreductase [SAR202 cluster bacterium]|tara:strand:- start:9340 stop:9765 length:426 start_codon:yes stop_codon:yes gene_type:complete